MKKLVLTLLVVALAIPAMAADISLVDNGDGTGTIVLTVTGIEVVRGLAIVVDADVDVTAVAGTDAIFNVFMDAAYTAETATPGSYSLGDGTPVADPDAAGELALPAAKISLCMGILDAGQGGAGAGTYVVGTITTGAATVAITADALRGGIVGDDLDAATIAGGPIGPGGPACACWNHSCFTMGDANGDGFITSQDVQALLAAWGQPYEECVDFNQDGFITSQDVQVLLASWGSPCP
ncbi:MAG: hypothetical protein FVQ82_05050 [Planctomycetes bacterium]|nr:hypothetical protein [Planctomycetota bacterium]